jgi:hypothetical protein
LVGLCYYQGRLVGFGVTPALFPESFESYLTMSYIVILIAISHIILTIEIVVGSIALVAIILTTLDKKTTFDLRKFRRHLRARYVVLVKGLSRIGKEGRAS